MARGLLIGIGFVVHLLSHPLAIAGVLLAAGWTGFVFDRLPRGDALWYLVFPGLVIAGYVGLVRLVNWSFARLLQAMGAASFLPEMFASWHSPFWDFDYDGGIGGGLIIFGLDGDRGGDSDGDGDGE
jgi:hypothetical protein